MGRVSIGWRVKKRDTEEVVLIRTEEKGVRGEVGGWWEALIKMESRKK